MATTAIDKMVDHLSFLGYDMERKGQDESPYVVASHEARPNLVLRNHAGGILIQSAFKSSDAAKADTEGYLSFMNSLNMKANVTRYYADNDWDFVIEAWHPDMYDRSAFGIFMDMWHRDYADSLSTFSEEVAKFLG
jgi:hypothetical protein